MDHSDYSIFGHLARTLHFSRTAKMVGMSASALTRRVQAMEEELGQRLLIRDHREIRLTAAGTRFLSFCQQQGEQWEGLLSDLKSEAAAPTGSLHIACTVTATHTVLPKLLSNYRKLYPGVTLRLITQDATRSLAQLEAGEVDLAVIPTEDDAADQLAVTHLGSSEFSFIGPSPENPWRHVLACPQLDLSEVPFVVPIGGLERKRLNAWFKEHRVEPQIVAEVRGNEGIIAMVSLGAGLGMVPELVLQSSPLKEKVEIVQSVSSPTGYNVSLCSRPRNLERRNIQLFWQLAQSPSQTSAEGNACATAPRHL
jgi:LysR family positive regulator for ilvC